MGLAVIEKPPEIAERLLGVIGKSALLRMLDNEQKDALVKAFSGPRVRPPGEDIIVVAAAMQKREQYVGFLKDVPILSSLTEMEVMTLADSLSEETYQDGQVICAQGDEGNFFYIIKSGKAICSQLDATGEDKVVAELTDGSYLGEVTLLTSKPRQATVKASGELKVLAVDRATFTRVMGPLDDLMKRNMEQYNKYAAQGI